MSRKTELRGQNHPDFNTPPRYLLAGVTCFPFSAFFSSDF